MDLKTEIQNRLNDLALALDAINILDSISIERHKARMEELQWVLSLLQPNSEVEVYGKSFDVWLWALKHHLVAQYGYTVEAAASYVGDGSDWREYYDEEYSPAAAAAEDASE